MVARRRTPVTRARAGVTPLTPAPRVQWALGVLTTAHARDAPPAAPDAVGPPPPPPPPAAPGSRVPAALLGAVVYTLGLCASLHRDMAPALTVDVVPGVSLVLVLLSLLQLHAGHMLGAAADAPAPAPRPPEEAEGLVVQYMRALAALAGHQGVGARLAADGAFEFAADLLRVRRSAAVTSTCVLLIGRLLQQDEAVKAAALRGDVPAALLGVVAAGSAAHERGECACPPAPAPSDDAARPRPPRNAACDDRSDALLALSMLCHRCEAARAAVVAAPEGLQSVVAAMALVPPKPAAKGAGGDGGMHNRMGGGGDVAPPQNRNAQRTACLLVSSLAAGGPPLVRGLVAAGAVRAAASLLRATVTSDQLDDETLLLGGIIALDALKAEPGALAASAREGCRPLLEAARRTAGAAPPTAHASLNARVLLQARAAAPPAGAGLKWFGLFSVRAGMLLLVLVLIVLLSTRFDWNCARAHAPLNPRVADTHTHARARAQKLCTALQAAVAREPACEAVPPPAPPPLSIAALRVVSEEAYGEVVHAASDHPTGHAPATAAEAEAAEGAAAAAEAGAGAAAEAEAGAGGAAAAVSAAAATGPMGSIAPVILAAAARAEAEGDLDEARRQRWVLRVCTFVSAARLDLAWARMDVSAAAARRVWRTSGARVARAGVGGGRGRGVHGHVGGHVPGRRERDCGRVLDRGATSAGRLGGGAVPSG